MNHVDTYAPLPAQESSSSKKVVLAGVFALVGCAALVAAVVVTSNNSGSNPAVASGLLAGIDWDQTGSHTYSEYQSMFEEFASTYGKQYDSDEVLHRFTIFKQNVDFINYYNKEVSSHKLAVNQFADLTLEEFKKSYVGLSGQKSASGNVFDGTHIEAADSIDWRSASGNPKSLVAVTPVKNQQQCGSCWAFSTTGATEGRNAIANGKLVSLSEQQLVDCSGSYGNQGCMGGLMDYGFQYIQDHGICTEESYPYTAQDGSCKASSCSEAIAKGAMTGHTDVPQNDNDSLLKAVSQGPVSVAIEADQSAFQFYSGGVFDASCGTQLDHGVLVVGYGSENGEDYWIVKNSWGASWGDNGYILMKRESGSSHGICGIAMQPSYPEF